MLTIDVVRILKDLQTPNDWCRISRTTPGTNISVNKWHRRKQNIGMYYKFCGNLTNSSSEQSEKVPRCSSTTAAAAAGDLDGSTNTTRRRDQQ